MNIDFESAARKALPDMADGDYYMRFTGYCHDLICTHDTKAEAERQAQATHSQTGERTAAGPYYSNGKWTWASVSVAP
jgi:hypothetical protein